MLTFYLGLIYKLREHLQADDFNVSSTTQQTDDWGTMYNTGRDHGSTFANCYCTD